MLKKNLATLIIAILSIASAAAQQHIISLSINNTEKWWSGVINEAHLMPYSKSSLFDFQMLGNNAGNQVQPLLISNKGRYVWSDEPFEFKFAKGILQITSIAKIDTGTAGNSLKQVQHFVRNKYFAASGKMPDTSLVTRPQYNTWVELNYNQNEIAVIKYAHSIIDNGLPPGVLMIDDTWQENYGVWDFHPRRFPHPKQMMDELHSLGFKVMVWICPFVSPDSKEFRELSKKKCLIKDNTGKAMMISWWNGYSAELDLSNPLDIKWFKDKLNYLQDNYGVDGFKFDAGDFDFYPKGSISYKNTTANDQSNLYAKIGIDYTLNEYRACWKEGGKPLVQRLRDKEHTWEDLNKLVPGMTLTGLIGYTFSCPDMIGGGEIESFWLNEKNLDQDLIVRSAQCHALMPMMQFSVAPWRVLDAVHFDAVKKAVALRQKFVPLIMQLVKASAQSGEPVVKNMEYVFPNQGFEENNSQFMLGDNIMVTPMLQKGTQREVIFPKLKKGKWVADDGKTFKGGTTTTIHVPLERLPFFTITK
jgi:alpha-glucosidase (family GH31 glycosyl hydrolase)